MTSNSMPVIEYGLSLVTYKQIVSVETAHKYENILIDALRGDPEAFDDTFTVALFNARHPHHRDLPGANDAADSGRLVFVADMPYDVFSSFISNMQKH